MFFSRRQALAAAKSSLSFLTLYFTTNTSSNGVSFPIPPCFCPVSPVDGTLEEEISPIDRVSARPLFDYKAVMLFLYLMITVFRVEDDHICDKLWCQFYKHTYQLKSKTPLIQFFEYSCEFHNSDASIVLVELIVWVMRL